jgi:hypothetical protein
VDQKAKARDMLEAERYASASDLVHVSVVWAGPNYRMKTVKKKKLYNERSLSPYRATSAYDALSFVVLSSASWTYSAILRNSLRKHLIIIYIPAFLNQKTPFLKKNAAL